MNKKSSSAFAFNSGDFVVYPAHGVGKIADIAKQKIAGSELELIVVNFDKDKMDAEDSDGQSREHRFAQNFRRGYDERRAQRSERQGQGKENYVVAPALRNMRTKSIPAIRLRLPKLSAICTAARIWPNSLTASGRFMNRRWTGWQTRLQSAKIFLQPSTQKAA